MSALFELAARCEAASGPDRELDCLIWCATAESHFEYYGGECVLAVQGGFSARLDWKDIPHPTASLDAAMKLVPEGWGFKAEHEMGFGTMFTVGHVGPNGMYDRPEGWAKAATPALALTAASLRVRSSITGAA